MVHQHRLSLEEEAGLQDIQNRFWSVEDGPSPVVIIGESPSSNTLSKPYPAFPERVAGKDVPSTRTLLDKYHLPRGIFDTAYRINAVCAPINGTGEPLCYDGDGSSPDIQIYASVGEARLDSVLQALARTSNRKRKFIAAFGAVARYTVFNWLSVHPQIRPKSGISKIRDNGFYLDVESSKHGVFQVLMAQHPSEKLWSKLTQEQRPASYAEISANVARWANIWQARTPSRGELLEQRLARQNKEPS